MRHSARGALFILALAGLGLAVLVLGPFGSRPVSAAPGPSQVLVINGASQPVPTTPAAPTVIAEQTVAIGFAGTTIVGPFDVGAYGKIRVLYDMQTTGFVRCDPQIVATNGHVFQLDDPMSTTFPLTKVYDVPGPTFRLTCFQDASTVPVLHIAIYGL